jgi:nucleoside-diphosphate-sugar epimerase
MKTLLTGAAGFVGSHLVGRLIERGDDVVAVEREGGSRGWLGGLDVDFHACGLNDAVRLETLMRDVQVVYHLAALTEARRHATKAPGSSGGLCSRRSRFV